MTAGHVPTTASGGGIPPIRRPQTVPGPAYAGPIGHDEPWGAWLDVPHGGLVAVDLRWGDGAGVPMVRMATPEGEWWVPDAQPGPPVHRAWIEVPAGWTWISIEAAFGQSLEVDVATHLPVPGGAVG